MSSFRAVSRFAPLFLASFLVLSTTSGGFATELATKEVLQKCRAALLSERKAIMVRWSKELLPYDYRQAAGVALQNETVGGWITHANPNRALTIVIHAFDSETHEGHFIVLVKNKGLILKDDVSAFEFAFSRIEHDGMTGLFFCSKTGPSLEWVWGGGNWKIAK
ncbi:MAG TPA: hypothetical protein VH079_17105 [Terriglobales bacterium]|jgi:hypothetical protein|nr:hypothetical protein [Terriglobales bacterium]